MALHEQPRNPIEQTEMVRLKNGETIQASALSTIIQALNTLDRQEPGLLSRFLNHATNSDCSFSARQMSILVESGLASRTKKHFVDGFLARLSCELHDADHGGSDAYTLHVPAEVTNVLRSGRVSRGGGNYRFEDPRM